LAVSVFLSKASFPLGSALSGMVLPPLAGALDACLVGLAFGFEAEPPLSLPPPQPPTARAAAVTARAGMENRVVI
jgi:hypothetical protein